MSRTTYIILDELDRLIAHTQFILSKPGNHGDMAGYLDGLLIARETVEKADRRGF